MKKVKGFRLWNILYPVGLYYVVSSLMYFVLVLLMGDADGTYMLRQLICAVATIPVSLSFYRQDKAAEDVVFGVPEKKIDAKRIKEWVSAAVATAALGIVVNNVIAMTPLMQVSEGFKEANEAFFAGTVVLELLGSCLMIPIAEELLFRGVVYKRMRLLSGVKPAILFSALLFGILHVNLVQFLYATILGLLLAFLLEKTRRLSVAVIGHIAANTIAVIRAETGWLDFSYQADAAGIGFTLVMAFVAAVVIWYLWKEYQNE